MAKTRPVILLVTALPALMMAACSGTPKYRPAPVTPQAMLCDGHMPAQVTLFSPADARLVIDGKSYSLKRIESASGARYGNADISFWNKGGIDALVTRKDGTTSYCTLTPRSGL